MTYDPKNIERAIFNYQKKQDLGSSREPRRKNKKPEKLVEQAVLEWAKQNDIYLHVVDSSNWDARWGRDGVSKAPVGFPDTVGNDLDGRALYIELKAKDRRSRLSRTQRDFLTDKIEQGCFAVVVDSAEGLEQYWKGFHSLKSREQRISYLLDCLPKQRPSKHELNFD